MLMPWQKRVLDERDELVGRISRLNFFLNCYYKNVSEAERGRLRVQLYIMRAYLGVLEDRIAAWGSK